jgi:uncharacterized protein
MHTFADLQGVEAALDRLTERELGRWLDRRPGQKEARYTHLLEDEGGTDIPPTVDRSAPPEADAPAGELAQLRRDVEALRSEVAAIRQQLTEGR